MTLMPEIRDQLLGAAERRATARRPRLLAPLGRLLGYGVLAGSIAIVVAVVAVIVLAGGDGRMPSATAPSSRRS
jgi:hypothetical protein